MSAAERPAAQRPVAQRHALVIGGTGVVGSAVLGELHARDIRTTFTYHRASQRAAEQAQRFGQQALPLDLADSASVSARLSELGGSPQPPDILIQCAGDLCAEPLLEMDEGTWERSYAVNARGVMIACRDFARQIVPRGGGDIVLVGALDRGQSLPMPVSFAACQGLLSALVMALGKELGGQGVRINLVALGLMEHGMSTGLDEELRRDYLAFSALRRFGKASEAAQAIVWLALQNRYMTGRVMPVNGGI